jgi:hypothetical protein
MSLILDKNSSYKYNNSIVYASWPEGKEIISELNKVSGHYQKFLYPIEFEKTKGFTVSEVNVNTDSQEALDFLGEAPEKLPVNKNYMNTPIGIIKDKELNDLTPIKIINCDEVFKTFDSYSLPKLNTSVVKETLNKVIKISSEELNGSRVRVINIEKRSTLAFKGDMNGTGQETTSVKLIEDTRVPFELVTDFRYEYKKGKGAKRETLITKGRFISKLAEISKYYEKETSLSTSADTEENKKPAFVRFFVDKDGVLIPIAIDETIKTNVHVDLQSSPSSMYYQYYIKNIKQGVTDYVSPFTFLEIGKTQIHYPKIEIIDAGNSDYKIPGKIGNSIISKGVLIINDKKRELAFYESYSDSSLKLDKLINFELVNNMPVFKVSVNSTPVDATISLNTFEPVISTRLMGQLGLKSRKLTLSKTNPQKTIAEKAPIMLIGPDDPKVKNIEAFVEKIDNEPYDIKLGLNYIRYKEVIINYKDKWLYIQ